MEYCVQLSSQLEERCEVIEVTVGQGSVKQWRVSKGHYRAEWNHLFAICLLQDKKY